jgi:nicotinate-nucleotide adenylyltransferase
VNVAADVADALGLERVLLVPAGEPPHKPSRAVTPAELRLEMTRAAAAGDPRLEVSTLELDRPGPSYTVDTLRALDRLMPDAELFLILGADQFRVFDTWHEPEAIARLARLAVMDREGASARALAGDQPGAAEAVFAPVRRIDVSSTEIRERCREGRDISGLVPPAVQEIIARERLYSAS